MRNKQIIILLSLCLCFACAKAQFISIDNDSNLIYNPSFEEHLSCPQRIDPYGYMDEPTAWWQPTNGSADYYNNCGGKQCQVPKNKLGIQYPRSGGSMVGIYCSLTDYREYIETELKDKLQKGETYHLSFYVSLSEYSPEAVATIAGLLSSKMISDTCRTMLTQNDIKVSESGIKQKLATYYKPQVVNPFAKPLVDTINWMKIEGDFVAEGGEKFLTIGNFYPAEQSNVVSPNGLRHILPGAYYYIDDVELYCTTCGKTKQIGDISITKTKDTMDYSVGKVIVLENIFFDFDKSVLLPQSYVELHNLINLLNSQPNMKIELSGHTDNKGKDKYNLQLSLDRAKAVYDYLILAGIDKKRLKFKGYGSTQPIADNKTDEGRAKNRRVEFKITDL